MPGVDECSLWHGLNEYIHSTMGIVGIAKMLGQRSEVAAEELWTGRVTGVLERLAEHVPVRNEGPARFSLSDGVSIQFEIHTVVILVNGAARLRAMLLAEPVALALGMIARQRCGLQWAASGGFEALPRLSTRRTRGSDIAQFPWIAPNPDGPAPWTSASSEEDANEAVMIESLGQERVVSLFMACVENAPERERSG